MLVVDELELDAGRAEELYAAIDELRIEVGETAGPDAEHEGKAETGGMSIDVLQLYGRDIQTLPRLTAAREVELAKRIERGDQDARPALIDANLRLVVPIAKRHLNEGLTFLRLIEAGTFGLARAAASFDHRKGFRFSSYAAWWIHRAVAGALADRARPAGVPD